MVFIKSGSIVCSLFFNLTNPGHIVIKKNSHRDDPHGKGLGLYRIEAPKNRHRGEFIHHRDDSPGKEFKMIHHRDEYICHRDDLHRKESNLHKKDLKKNPHRGDLPG